MPPMRAAGLTGTQQQIADYLLEEVLERQPDNLKTFLLGTSILDRMTPPPVRCGARHGRRGRFARGPRALECVRRPARRSRRVVPLPPPVQ